MSKLLVLDIETSSRDIIKNGLKVVGFYLSDIDEYKCIENKNKHYIQKIIDSYDVIITFNGKEFDIPYMELEGYKLRNKIHIDLYDLIRYKRESMIKFEGFSSYSLKNLVKELKIDDVGKGDIDYDIFKKDSWTIEEKEEIKKYLFQDLKLTWKLWLYLDNHFKDFKQLLSIKENDFFKYINTTAGGYAYSAICNMIGLSPRYIDSNIKVKYEGGYVSIPTKENAIGNIICLDFSSAYPHAFFQMNLFSSYDSPLKCKCCNEEDLFVGNEMFPIKGRYCSKKMGIIESKLKEIYLQRKTLGKKHPLNIPLKVMLNTMYGISAKPTFYWVYSENTAGDCTLIARNCLKYARKIFTEKGYDVLYSDTDSVYIHDIFNDEEKIIKIKEEIIQNIKKFLLFPSETFDMGIDARIKYIQFFRNDNGDFLKKNYLYITENNKIKIKGLAVIKKNCSSLSKEVFNSLKESIITNLNCKFSESEIKKTINELMNKDLSLIGTLFHVKDLKSYSSNTSIQYLITEKYGKGEHILIKNKRIGVGKGVKYCSIEEAKKLSVKDLDLTTVWNELSPFIYKDYKEDLLKWV